MRSAKNARIAPPLRERSVARLPVRARAIAAAPALALTLAMACTSPSRAAMTTVPVAGPATQVSTGCASASGNAEVQTASDPAHGFVYDVWISCRRIGFARSADGGRTWQTPVLLPVPPTGASPFTWDPAITVARTGIVYASFMSAGRQSSYPVVDISTDHGGTFRARKVGTPPAGNFGDRDFVAVGPRGQIYVTWDYGPNGSLVHDQCFPDGSCAFVSGDLNAVLQKSTDGGKTWSKITPIAPGFPDSGSISAPILVQPGGRIDVLYERYQMLSKSALTLGTGHDYFTSSGDQGRTWTRPVRLGPAGSTLSPNTWWIDGSLGTDSAGNLYATWDTQSGGTDTGWLSYSVTGGRTWSRPVRVTSSPGGTVNIVQVLGGAQRTAYIGLLTDGSGHGYVQSLRPFAIGDGWLTKWVRVSPRAGSQARWPGGTIGLAPASSAPAGQRRVDVSWGSTVTTSKGPQIYAAIVGGLP